MMSVLMCLPEVLSSPGFWIGVALGTLIVGVLSFAVASVNVKDELR